MEKLKKFMADQHETKLKYNQRSRDNYQFFIMINKNAHDVCEKVHVWKLNVLSNLLRQ